jgi:hypothetical protein
MYFQFMALMQRYSKQQRKSGNESTLKKLNIHAFLPIVLKNGAKPLLTLHYSTDGTTGTGKKN